MILNAMRVEEMRDHPEALGYVLSFAIAHHVGPELADWAELQFQRVYGIHTRGFIEHMTAYLP